MQIVKDRKVSLEKVEASLPKLVTVSRVFHDENKAVSTFSASAAASAHANFEYFINFICDATR